MNEFPSPYRLGAPQRVAVFALGSLRKSRQEPTSAFHPRRNLTSLVPGIEPHDPFETAVCRIPLNLRQLRWVSQEMFFKTRFPGFKEAIIILLPRQIHS